MKKILVLLLLLLCLTGAAAHADVTVRFDLAGGQGGFAPLKPVPDENGVVHFSLPDTAPVRKGYRFIGWNCLGLEMEYALDRPGDPIAFQCAEGTITYVAQWENNVHQESCPYLIAWIGGVTWPADIIQVDFKCIQEATSTYYCPLCWYGKDGYAGFQILDDGTHVVIMSMWDDGSMKPTIEYAPNSRMAREFTGEGTGKQFSTDYDWAASVWYTLRIQARTSGNKTIYEMWIRPENGRWEKLCAISYPEPGCGINGCCSFLEDYYPFSNLRRSMQLRNFSVRLVPSGRWQKNLSFDISNFADQRLTEENVPYNCKAEAAGSSALFMQSGGGGYEKVIRLPKNITLETCDIVDRYMLE